MFLHTPTTVTLVISTFTVLTSLVLVGAAVVFGMLLVSSLYSDTTLLNSKHHAEDYPSLLLKVSSL